MLDGIGVGKEEGGETYDFDSAVPRARAERILRDEVPMHSVHFSVVFLPRLDGKFVETDIEEFDGAVAGCDQDLILVALGPGEVVEGVLRVKP